MKVTNKRAFHDYFVTDRFEAGLSLLGSEVQAIRLNRANINSAYVRIRGGEAWLVGGNIPLSEHSRIEGYDPGRSRKVLLHRKELTSLSTKIAQERLTLVPISLYNKGRLVKVQIGLGKGKKQYEKREAKRRKDLDLEAERDLRQKD